MSFNKSYIDQMKVMGALPHELRLEQENAQLKAELAQCREELCVAERALLSKGYRKSCDIPACNCGDQWNHGGDANTRLREIGDALPYVNGKTILTRVQDIVEDLAQATRREARMREALALFMACMNRYGIWEDGCFYYAQHSATELQIPIEKARVSLEEAGT